MRLGRLVIVCASTIGLLAGGVLAGIEVERMKSRRVALQLFHKALDSQGWWQPFDESLRSKLKIPPALTRRDEAVKHLFLAAGLLDADAEREGAMHLGEYLLAEDCDLGLEYLRLAARLGATSKVLTRIDETGCVAYISEVLEAIEKDILAGGLPGNAEVREVVAALRAQLGPEASETSVSGEERPVG